MNPIEEAAVEQLKQLQHTVDRILERLDVVVRLEERQDGLNRRTDRLDVLLDGHGLRLGKLETDVAASSQQTGMLERAAWIAATAIVGALAYFIGS